ncbi:hypothetical protein [Novosphingobium album (ex Liu et al. 2023)]|uniref:Lipoprotein n=1 Tax=Novosphingobium album (ex Liu et al. 2023) TaxID=3031130 RepID=A0ABT5WJC7_9SPHN|nr:hypothetical protein [Novosphingobium album (ex Liu et al. 2023)]MDE8650149.1 hypothetical protein [Novosphingobium album (ex Liu et al. 2023)]
MKNIHGLLLVSCSALALAGCGPSDIAGPGTGGDVIINNPAPTPTPSPTPTPGAGLVEAASSCPTIAASNQLTDNGILSGPTGTYRVCTLPKLIDRSTSLPKITGLVYQMNGRVDVGCDGGFAAPTTAAPVATSTVGCPTSNLTADTNVTLTIAPGAILIGAPGASWLAVNRGNKINAAGTATSPIIFTSRDNVTGQVSETSQGHWGGVVLMGRAAVTDCTAGTVASGNCERQTEGSTDPARFGGADSAYNAGTMKYVQFRYSGFILSANIELQSLTGEGIGSGTTLDHIMSYNSSDDGSEWFGGSPNMKYYISVGADDDSLDVDTGAQMNVQYALLIQRSGQGDALMEIDSNGNEADTPRTKLAVANFTALQPQTSSNNEGNDLASILLRGNSDTTWVNGLIITPNNECLRMNGSGGTPATLKTFSVALQCNAAKFLGSGSYTADQVSTMFGSGANTTSTFTSTLASLFINGANETGRTATDPKATSAFFDTTTYVGAVKDSADTWYAGWTCNSATANFGSGNSGACTSLPTT